MLGKPQRVLDGCEKSYMDYQRELNAILKDGDQRVIYSKFRFPSPPPDTRAESRAPSPDCVLREVLEPPKRPPVAASTPQEPVLAASKSGHRKLLDSDIAGAKKTLHFDSGSSSGTTGSSSNSRNKSRVPGDVCDFTSTRATTKDRQRQRNQVIFQNWISELFLRMFFKDYQTCEIIENRISRATILK